MIKELFDADDLFDTTTETLRKEIAGIVARHWTDEPAALELDPEARFQMIATALTVSLCAYMKIVTGMPDSMLMLVISNSLPSAFETASDIIANSVPHGEAKH